MESWLDASQGGDKPEIRVKRLERARCNYVRIPVTAGGPNAILKLHNDQQVGKAQR